MYNYSNYKQDDYMMPAGMQVDNVMPSSQPYSPNVTNSYEGFIRGNMFTDLYKPYINAEPFRLTPKSEQEALLDKVREYGFAAFDLNLYLDTHPDDAEKIKLYNQYMTQAKQAEKEYETKYGPLSNSSDTLNSYPWAWLMSPWPWEVK